MIPGLCINKSKQSSTSSKQSSTSNSSLPYMKQSNIMSDILEDSIIGEFYGRIFHYNGGGKKKKMKQTRKIKKGMKKKTKKRSSYSSFFK